MSAASTLLTRSRGRVCSWHHRPFHDTKEAREKTFEGVARESLALQEKLPAHSKQAALSTATLSKTRYQSLVRCLSSNKATVQAGELVFAPARSSSPECPRA